MLSRHMHGAHAQSLQQVRHAGICQTTGAGQNKSSLYTLLLRGTYIISWMRLHGFGHGAPQGRERFGTFTRAWQRGVLYSLWENHMLHTTWARECAKIDLRSPIGGDLCSKSVKWERKVTFTLRASYSKVILNINSTVSMLNTLLPKSGCAEHIFPLRRSERFL